MSTSKLQREVSQLLSVYLGQYIIRENIRPDWLITEMGKRLELDFFIEEPMVAIEVQGRQHYEYTPYFHKTYADFEAQLSRDNAKRQLCKNRGVILYEVVSSSEVLEIITRLCPRREMPTHPNAIEQERKIRLLPPLGRKALRNLISLLFTEHEHTPKKHLGKLLYALTKYEEAGELIPKEEGRIQTSLTALRQYQEVGGEIQFTDYEYSILKKAQSLVSKQLF